MLCDISCLKIESKNRKKLPCTCGILQQRGETVELSVLNDTKEVEAILLDDRTLRGPLAPLAARLAK
jgi:hypothetical protein